MPDPVIEPETVEPKVEPVVEPGAEPKVEPVVEPKVEAKPEPKPEDWRDRRIAELTHKLNKANKVAPASAAAPVPGESEAVFQARVLETAAQLTEINDWNKQCETVATTGRAEFPDFNARLAACQSVVNPQDPVEVAQFDTVLKAAVATGQAHKLLHALGETPGEVAKLMKLSPIKMAVELATRAAKLGEALADPEPSAAPKPITPVGSRGVHYDGIKPDDAANGTKLPIREWMKQREAQAIERGMQ